MLTLRKLHSSFYSWIALTMCVLLALESIGVGGEERIRHGRSNHAGISPNSSSERADLEREFDENRNQIYSATWTCGEPKPRLVYMEEALNYADTVPNIPSHLSWVVTATVMYRCEARFGCCTPPRTCTPVQSETVEVTFKTRNVNTGASTYYRIPFSNHTSCMCR